MNGNNPGQALLEASACMALLSRRGGLGSDGVTGIVEQGEDFTRYGKAATVPHQEGSQPAAAPRGFTLLGSAMNYFEDGEWKRSEDLIEPFPGGGVARRGPHKAVFSHDLHAEAVFDIKESDGGRLRGGVRAIQLRDLASGEAVVVGRVRDSVPGELLPPNRILYPDAFEGAVRADVLLVWKHDGFVQNVILRSRMQLPDGLEAETTVLEIVTEFTEAPRPEVRRDPGGTGEVDDAVLVFGRVAMVPGQAFPVEAAGDDEFGWDPERHGERVRKKWHELEDGRRFLVESVHWKEVSPHLALLEPPEGAAGSREARRGGSWPERVAGLNEPSALPIRREKYKPAGYLVDFVLIPNSRPTTFVTGETYIVHSHYYNGTSATFEPGCVFKHWGRATLTLYGTFSFPDTLQSVVFTSVDDDAFGEKFPGTASPNVPASGGNPAAKLAHEFIRVWHLNHPTEIRNAIFRWSWNGIEYWRTGAAANHVIRNCRFEHFQSGGQGHAIEVGIPAENYVVFVSSVKCKVDMDHLTSSGIIYSGLTEAPFCIEQSFFGFSNTERTPPQIRQQLSMTVPDSMGAAGPEHYVELVNSGAAVFDKATGALVEHANAVTLFGAPAGTELVDPRIVYDQQWGRWVACMLDKGAPRQVYVATSQSASPVGLANWEKFPPRSLVVPGTSLGGDFPTLGLDSNGIYIAVRLTEGDVWNPTAARHAIIPIKKPPGGGNITAADIKPTQYIAGPGYGYLARWMTPVVNRDPVAPDDSAWLLSKGEPGAAGGAIQYRRLRWSNGEAVIDPAWTSISLPSPYYDLDEQPYFALPQRPVPGRTFTPNLLGGSRLQMAIIQAGYLYTCHHIGLDGGDPVYHGQTVDRTAVQWLRLRVESGLSLALLEPHRIYDSANSDPYFYAYPSLALNAAGDVVIGFSCARATEFIGAVYWGRRPGGAMTSRPALLQAGRAYFHFQRWGDYSATSPDPNGHSLWTIQEYAELPTFNGAWPGYGLWISEIAPNP